jgi:two-component system, NtrC family, response regulator PilR
VRELENVLERAMTLCDAGVIGPEDVQLRDVVLYRVATGEDPAAARGAGEAAAPGATAAGAPPPASSSAAAGAAAAFAAGAASGALGTQLEEVERAAIVRALEQTRYNKTAAAKLLGMTFRALRYRIKKLGIE